MLLPRWKSVVSLEHPSLLSSRSSKIFEHICHEVTFVRASMAVTLLIADKAVCKNFAILITWFIN